MATCLDFEKQLKSIQDDIDMASMRGDNAAKAILEKDYQKELKKVFGNMSDYQKLQLARHPDRPYALDYMELLLKDAYEICGDRHFRDDKAIVCMLGKIDEQPTMVIGEEKGRGGYEWGLSGDWRGGERAKRGYRKKSTRICNPKSPYDFYRHRRGREWRRVSHRSGR